jgi:hypothetical protein
MSKEIGGLTDPKQRAAEICDVKPRWVVGFGASTTFG